MLVDEGGMHHGSCWGDNQPLKPQSHLVGWFMQFLPYILFHSFGLLHTGCMIGSSGPTNHFEKLLWMRERGSLPHPLVLWVSKWPNFPAVVPSWPSTGKSLCRFVQSSPPSGSVMGTSSSGQPVGPLWEERTLNQSSRPAVQVRATLGCARPEVLGE